METLKLLVAVDFSEPSRLALAWAFDYAARAPCEVHVVHVVETHLGDLRVERTVQRFQEELEATTREAEQELATVVHDREGRERVGVVTRHVACGNPAHEVVAVAEKIGADMIVMGSHGRTGLAGLVMGSVAQKVLKHADCPVVCVKARKARAKAA